MKHYGDFNGDLKFGQCGENDIRNMLESVEVKTDKQVATTGNVVIEFECSGKPSGIATSNAKYWAILFEEEPFKKKVAILIEREYLLRHCQAWAVRIVEGGDGNRAKMWVIPKARLLSYP